MIESIMKRLGVADSLYREGDYAITSPTDGAVIGKVTLEGAEEVAKRIDKADQAFTKWRQIPAPRRGELVRLFGEQLRKHKEDLGALVTLECGKILQEGLGEVQEMIDICDLAVGQSRQLYGLTIASERSGHHMRESWHPLGPVAIITAFNFPVAPWAWNAALALVCGNSLLWKPSEKTPLSALACQALLEKAITEFGDDAPEGLSQVIIGDRKAGERLVDDSRIPLVSATGSTRMGREIAPKVATRFGRSILELGGNNAMILAPSADIDMAIRAILFSAVGTAGQRCTTLRRLIVHESIHDDVLARLKKSYAGISVGDPMEGHLVGPLIDEDSFNQMQTALSKARDLGAPVFGGERQLVGTYPDGYYVAPAIVEMSEQNELVKSETFAPILYVLSYKDFDEALALNNGVPQGLSSCIFTTDVREAESFVSDMGSDCGIANVNIGPSGAEIGGAFGGEKETGGGRESGSDVWKSYMRRQTNTVNYSRELPLAQGIKFD
ncbi:aldehyde dehydrogenase family protein [Oceanimonas baumannii]|uniref:aldehyde dehydrogenase (NAD(+)) n=1 Tax=Oceanimonas baumannii TaxID=129578 RepID=A0A235CMA2_9GAMM|nr:aldehyde dehydrogenase family protein [Oceanimonas baumannii]OYD25157.1 aldehyde dehydrogenase family protein [Oceanimonas baumannii]TDW62557.1 aldehyde dehydrogenase (NAD+) [Oceanimonas baumannii]